MDSNSDAEKGSLAPSLHEQTPKPRIHAWRKGDDEALKVLAEHIGEEPVTEEESRKLRNKIDWRILPIIGLYVSAAICWPTFPNHFVDSTFGLQSVDKASLGIAAVFGLIPDLELSVTVNGRTDTSRYSLVSSFFYIGFIVGAAPLAMLAQRYPMGRVCAIYCLVWGIIEILTPACTNMTGILALRFFLGFVESGVSPALLLLISSWYRQQEQALRAAYYYSCAGFLATICYPIYVGIAKAVPHAPGTVPAAWREIFYFCGGLTIVWSIVIWIWLPDSPVNASFLNEREKFVAVERLRADQTGMRSRTFKWKQGASCFWDVKIWLIWICTLAVAVPTGILTNFQSLIFVGVVGAGTYRSVLLSSPGAALGAVCSVLAGYLAQRYKDLRTFFYCFFTALCLLSTALLWKLPLTAESGLTYAIIALNTFGAAYSMCLGWTSGNVTGYSRRTVAASGTFVANALGNIIAPFLFRRYESPRYPSGFRDTTIILLIGFMCALLYCALCLWENARRNKLPAKETDDAFEDLTDVQNKAFRYRI